MEFMDRQYDVPDEIISISKEFKLEKDLEFKNREDSYIKELTPIEEPILQTQIYGDNTITLMYNQLLDKEDIAHITIINQMLSGGLKSPLYNEVREKNSLCYGIGAYADSIGEVNMNFIIVMTQTDLRDKVEEVIDMVLSNRDKYMTKERLEMVRKELVIEYEKEMINRHDNISDILYTKYKKLYDIIENVTIEDIHRVYDKYYSSDKFDIDNDRDFYN